MTFNTYIPLCWGVKKPISLNSIATNCNVVDITAMNRVSESLSLDGCLFDDCDSLAGNRGSASSVSGR